MTVYYDPQLPVYWTALDWRNYKHTAFAVVCFKAEFWAFLMFHALLVALTSTDIIPVAMIGEFPFDAVASVNFFMTFFLTFYNSHCYRRYMKLYEYCNGIIDSVLLFVFELSVSFHAEEVLAYRTQAIKYVLAAMYVFFMGLTGGDLTRKEWKELLQRGLISRTEMEALSNYPGGKITHVLLNWALQVVDWALENEKVFWERSEEKGGKRQQRIDHLHNRVTEHTRDLMLHCEGVGNLVGLPIPYPYYHLMNLVLVLNFFLVGVVLSLFQNYATIVLYSMMLLIFFGLREVATQLADPFGQDEADFPVAEFMNYCIHHAMCTLEAFNQQDEEALLQSVVSNMGFSDEQLRTAVDRDELYKQAGLKRNDAFNWENSSPLRFFESEESVVAHMHALLKPRLIKDLDFSNVPDDAAAEFREKKKLALLEMHHYRQKKVRLEKKIYELDVELQQLQRLYQEEAHGRVVDVAAPPTVTDPGQLAITLVDGQDSQQEGRNSTEGRQSSSGLMPPSASVAPGTQSLAVAPNLATASAPPGASLMSSGSNRGFDQARIEIRRIGSGLQLAGFSEQNRSGPDADEDAPPAPPIASLVQVESRSSSVPARGERDARDRRGNVSAQRRASSGDRAIAALDANIPEAGLGSFAEARERIRQARALAADGDAGPRPNRGSTSSRHRYRERFQDLNI